MKSFGVENISYNLDVLALHTETIPDHNRIENLKKLGSWKTIQDMVITCQNKSYAARVWYFHHPHEVEKIKIGVVVAAIDTALGLGVVYALNYLEQIKMP